LMLFRITATIAALLLFLLLIANRGPADTRPALSSGSSSLHRQADPVNGQPTQVAPPTTDADALEATVKAIVDAVSASKSASILPGIIVSRCGLSNPAAAVVDASGVEQPRVLDGDDCFPSQHCVRHFPKPQRSAPHVSNR
jgi:hypothetical protein